MKAVNVFFEDKIEFNFEGLNKLEHRWVQCIDVEGDFIGK
jgi:hypothetical protein